MSPTDTMKQSPNWAQTHPALILGEWEASWRIPQKLQHGPGSPGSNLSQRQTRVLRGMIRVPRTASAGSALRNLHLECPDVKFHGRGSTHRLQAHLPPN